MSGTKVLKCTCFNDFQDKEYGNQNRLHTISADGKKAHCTVCEGSGKTAKRNSKDIVKTTNRPYKSI